MLKLLYGKSKDEILAEQAELLRLDQEYADMDWRIRSQMAEQQYLREHAAKMESARKERLAKWERRRTAK